MSKQVLMCPSTYFDVEYDINAWMHAKEPVNKSIADEQWQQLRDIYTRDLGWEVKLIEPVEHLPDMPFATDNAVVLDGKVLLAKFRFPERQPEPAHFEEWFKANGFNEVKQTKNIFEGGGDTIVWGDKLLIGYGFRSSIESHQEAAEFFGRQVISLKLVDPYFYHMDTALGALDDQTVAYFPGAFDEQSQELLQSTVPNLIEATLQEAKGFGLNFVSDGKNVITSNESESLLNKYRQAGFTVHATPILEFRKSGGGVKCLTLELR